MDQRPTDSGAARGRPRRGMLAAALGGLFGLVGWAAAVSATWMAVVFVPEWRAIGAAGVPASEVVLHAGEQWARLPGVLAEGEYGYQFAMLSAYLWLGAGAVAGYVVASGGWRRVRLGAQLVVGMMFGSVRWLLAEASRVDRMGLYDGRFYFEEGVAWAPMLGLAVVALGLLWRARGREIRPSR